MYGVYGQTLYMYLIFTCSNSYPEMLIQKDRYGKYDYVRHVLGYVCIQGIKPQNIHGLKK